MHPELGLYKPLKINNLESLLKNKKPTLLENN